MRIFATFVTLVAFALATMVVHAGGARAMDGMADMSMMADMTMGAADAPACPPEMCAKMKDCVQASASLSVVAPVLNVSAFVPGIGRAHLGLHGPASGDKASGDGLRRPPRFI
ncbi:MAG: hypothetical protein LCH69_15915 [Proteobacteria bacterium]|nr:hypothetical protein [Pseudomonadota bacterium]